MAELTRYTDRMIRDSTPMPWDFYRADEVDALLRKRATYERESRRNALSQASSHIKHLQSDLDALREEGRRELDSAISAGWSEADAHYMPQIEQLQHDLNVAYAALREANEE